MSRFRFLILGFLGAAVLAGCGGSSSDPNPVPIPPIARFATYLVNADLNGSLGVNAVNPVTGELTEIAGSPFLTGDPTITLAVHPAGRLIYAGSDASTALQGFSLDPATGNLTELTGFPITSGPDGSPFFDASGQYLYVVGETDIDGFSVNQTSGALTRLAGFPLLVPGMLSATRQAVNVADTRVYIPDTDSDQLFVFSRNTITGSLALLEVVPSGADAPLGIGLTPSGDYLFVAHQDGNLTGFDVQADGTIEPLAGFPVAYAAGPAICYTMAFVDDAVFVSDAISDTLNAFRISGTGSLTQIAGYPVTGGGEGVYLYPSPFETILYLSDTSGNAFNAYIVNANESVSAVPGSPFPASGGAPTSLEGALVTF